MFKCIGSGVCVVMNKCLCGNKILFKLRLICNSDLEYVEKNPDQNPISLQINFFRKHTLKLNHQMATKPFVLCK